MKTLVPVMLVSLLALGGGCAQQDWVDRTLVTADVTGAWKNVNGSLDHTLEQQGARVTGSLFQRVANIRSPVAGTVTGDVFKFQATGTNAIYGGELMVDGDEMKGYVRSSGSRVNTIMRHVDSPPPTRQP